MKFIGIYKRGTRLIEGLKYTCTLTNEKITVGKSTVNIVLVDGLELTELDFDKCCYLVKVRYCDVASFKRKYPECQWVGDNYYPLWSYYKLNYPIGEWYNE